MKAKELRKHSYEQTPEGDVQRMQTTIRIGRAKAARAKAGRALRTRKSDPGRDGATCGINYRKEKPTTKKRRKIIVVEKRIPMEKAMPLIRQWLENAIRSDSYSLTAETIRVELGLPIHQIRQALQTLTIEGLVYKPRRPSASRGLDAPRYHGHLSGWRAKVYYILKKDEPAEGSEEESKEGSEEVIEG